MFLLILFVTWCFCSFPQGHDNFCFLKGTSYFGHSSRICPPVLEYAKAHDIIILTIPDHSFHITQLLDLSTNGVFKKCIRVLLTKYISKHNITVFNTPTYRAALYAILPEAIATACRVNEIKLGWKRTGRHVL